jgi:hypothetical protein
MRFWKRNLDAEWNLQRERNWERSRALRAMRDALWFLLFSSAVLAMAFARAWTNTEGLPVRRESSNWKTSEGGNALALRNQVERP